MTADYDLQAARDARTPPDRLADIASRRRDLHGVIAANPATPPALRQWMASVNARGGAPAAPALPPYARGPQGFGAASNAQQGFGGSPSPQRGSGAPQQGFGTAPHGQQAFGSPAGPQQGWGTTPHPQPGFGPGGNPAVGAPVLTAPPARRGRGWRVAGFGCLGIIAVIVVSALAIGGIRGAISANEADPAPNVQPPAQPKPTYTPPSAPTSAPTPTVDPEAAAVAEQLAAFATERDAYYALYAQLDGNPVAGLVARPVDFRWLEQQVDDPSISSATAASLVQEAATQRQSLQQRIDDAAARRGNSSGTIAEDLVDRIGNGYIDIQWDGSSACPNKDNGEWRTLGCVNSGDLLTVHLLTTDQFVNDWMLEMITVHEVGHVLHSADEYRFDDYKGYADGLLQQGMFEGSHEKLADCYALTYYDQWSLTNGDAFVGYGYVCNETERQAIRDWLADLAQPLPHG